VLLALAVIGIAAAAIAVFAGGGGSRTNSTAASSVSGTAAGGGHAGSHARGAAKGAHGAAGHAITRVAVLNGTESAGLAHRVAAQLHQSGFSRATALNGRPPGANQTTVVEYASGHRSDAQGVARALGVGQPQPVEATASSLGGSASVVVIVGLDKASAGP
jgi:hypothetical protein